MASSSNVESCLFFYVVLLVAGTFVASLLMPDLWKHGYRDGQMKRNTSFGRR